MSFAVWLEEEMKRLYLTPETNAAELLTHQEREPPDTHPELKVKKDPSHVCGRSMEVGRRQLIIELSSFYKNLTFGF